MKIETASLLPGGAPRRRVLFSDQTARGVFRVGGAIRAGVYLDPREWARWAAGLVTKNPRQTPLGGEGDIEVR